MKVLILLLTLFLFQCSSNKKQRPIVTTLPPVTQCGSLTTDALWYTSNQQAPVLSGLGNLHYTITTNNPTIQTYFDQGLILAYAFNHAEAARSFYTAIRMDSTCAMCYWGYAYVLGPNYNAGMEPDNYVRAYEAIQKSIALSENTSAKEKELIFALSKRYVKEPIENRRPLDSLYSLEMQKLHTSYPEDPEIAALYVESIMNLHPWDLWFKDGQPKPWTPAIISVIEGLIKKYPDHPGFHHFYIHAVEASFNPGRGLESARRFDQGLVPNAGHLVHMSSHIYIRTGNYHEGSLSNLHAVKVDSNYVTTCHAQGMYPLAYFPHNFHFLAATATLEGKQDWAIMGAEKVSAHANKELMKQPMFATFQHYYLIPYFVEVKFGLWDSILNRNEPMENLPYVKAIRNYARGFAYLGKRELSKSKEALSQLELASKDTILEGMTIWGINSVLDIVHIAIKVLHAEILAKEGDYTNSIKSLYEAVNIEDHLNYNEPPDWFFSVRHELGAILLENKKYDEAINVYLEDLKWLPQNGWAQHGLRKAYIEKKDKKRLTAIEQEIQQSWKYADIKLQSSRIL
ncbi:MAG: tetratricopeptide repeat protein [Saprospiraceae bacterium]